MLVHPFSFREFLRHCGLEPERPWSELRKEQRSLVENAFRNYLDEGGFPEAQGLAAPDRAVTWGREVRALTAAAAELPGFVPVLVTYDALPERDSLPEGVRWLPASAWLLGESLST